MADDVLILIDQQRAMEHPKWGPRNNRDAEQRIARLLGAWRERGGPVIHVKHDFDQPGLAVPAGAGGQRFPAPGRAEAGRDGDRQEGAQRLHRHRSHATPGGDGSSEAGVCGVLLANSVEATVRVAANLGFAVRLPADACWSVDKRDLTGRLWPAEDVHQLSLALLSGEYATITTVDEMFASMA